jgi:hypothetical protein
MVVTERIVRLLGHETRYSEWPSVRAVRGHQPPAAARLTHLRTDVTERLLVVRLDNVFPLGGGYLRRPTLRSAASTVRRNARRPGDDGIGLTSRAYWRRPKRRSTDRPFPLRSSTNADVCVAATPDQASDARAPRRDLLD